MSTGPCPAASGRAWTVASRCGLRLASCRRARFTACAWPASATFTDASWPCTRARSSPATSPSVTSDPRAVCNPPARAALPPSPLPRSPLHPPPSEEDDPTRTSSSAARALSPLDQEERLRAGLCCTGEARAGGGRMGPATGCRFGRVHVALEARPVDDRDAAGEELATGGGPHAEAQRFRAHLALEVSVDLDEIRT